jgi:hypothetical protein
LGFHRRNTDVSSRFTIHHSIQYHNAALSEAPEKIPIHLSRQHFPPPRL